MPVSCRARTRSSAARVRLDAVQSALPVRRVARLEHRAQRFTGSQYRLDILKQRDVRGGEVEPCCREKRSQRILFLGVRRARPSSSANASSADVPASDAKRLCVLVRLQHFALHGGLNQCADRLVEEHRHHAGEFLVRTFLQVLQDDLAALDSPDLRIGDPDAFATSSAVGGAPVCTLTLVSDRASPARIVAVVCFIQDLRVIVDFRQWIEFGGMIEEVLRIVVPTVES